MKSVFFQIVSLGIFSLFLLSCENNDSASLDKNLKEFMEFKNKNKNSEIGGVNSFMSVISASQFTSKNLNLAGYSSTENYWGDICSECKDSTWNYFTCATVTETNNEDGTTTTVYDYGDGCDEYGSLMKGKITYIWKNENNSYVSKVIYENFYSNGTEMNGYSENTFTSDGNSYFKYSNTAVNSGAVDDTTSYPEIEFNWSGTSSSKEVLTITTNDGKVYKYDSESSTKWDNTSYTVLTGVYNYSSKTDDYEYRYLVNKPLVTNYKCNFSCGPVSGIETTTSIKSGKKTMLEINYGNGTCDNYAYITENGKTTKIELCKYTNDLPVLNDNDVTNWSPSSFRVKMKKN